MTGRPAALAKSAISPPSTSTSEEHAVMQENDRTSSLREMDDPELLGRRAELRELLADTPGESAEAPALISEYADLTAEFDRRAHAEWTKLAEGRQP
jgi:hypothetical protein